MEVISEALSPPYVYILIWYVVGAFVTLFLLPPRSPERNLGELFTLFGAVTFWPVLILFRVIQGFDFSKW